MALVSVDAQNASLANDYGPTKGANAPTALQVALFAGDPEAGGVEVDTVGGYARPVVANNGTTWPDAPADGAITTALIDWAISTAEWLLPDASPAIVTHFLFFDDADGVTAWDSGELTNPISVDAAGQTPSAALTVYYNQVGA